MPPGGTRIDASPFELPNTPTTSLPPADLVSNSTRWDICYLLPFLALAIPAFNPERVWIWSSAHVACLSPYRRVQSLACMV